MLLGYARCSYPSAIAIAEASHGRIQAVRNKHCDINWGRSDAHSAELNPQIYLATNKQAMRQAFRDNGVPIPYLLSRTDLVDWRDCRSDYGVLVGRPDRHTHGRGFWLITNERELDRALRGTRKKKPATHFMQHIVAVHELRVHIFQGKSYRISEKLFEGRDGNHKLYTTIKPSCNEIAVKRARKAAKQAVAAVGLDFAAVDVLVDAEDNVYVLETNCAPGIGGSLPRMYADMFLEWGIANGYD